MTKITITPLSHEELERRLEAVQAADDIAFMEALQNDGEPPDVERGTIDPDSDEWQEHE